MDLSGTPVPDKSIPCASGPERYSGFFSCPCTPDRAPNWNTRSRRLPGAGLHCRRGRRCIAAFPLKGGTGSCPCGRGARLFRCCAFLHRTRSCRSLSLDEGTSFAAVTAVLACLCRVPACFLICWRGCWQNRLVRQARAGSAGRMASSIPESERGIGRRVYFLFIACLVLLTGGHRKEGAGKDSAPWQGAAEIAESTAGQPFGRVRPFKRDAAGGFGNLVVRRPEGDRFR